MSFSLFLISHIHNDIRFEQNAKCILLEITCEHIQSNKSTCANSVTTKNQNYSNRNKNIYDWKIESIEENKNKSNVNFVESDNNKKNIKTFNNINSKNVFVVGKNTDNDNCMIFILN